MRLRKHEQNKKRRQFEKAAIGATIAASKVNAQANLPSPFLTSASIKHLMVDRPIVFYCIGTSNVCSKSINSTPLPPSLVRM